MAAVDVADAARGVVEFREEQRGEGSVGSIFAEELIDGAEQPAWIDGHGALAAEIRLQVGHEQRGGNAFARDVADDQAKTLFAQMQEIVVIAADMASLAASTGKLQRWQGGKRLREEPRLNLFGDFQFLGRASFGLKLIGDGAALFFDAAGNFIEAHKGKRIAIGIA